MCAMAAGERPGGVRRLLAVVTVAPLLALTAGCGSASDPSPPAGVDGLTIPTPSIDPSDFEDEVDNPWLPLAAGSRWVYELSGVESGTVTVSVADEPVAVAGVNAAEVTTTWPDRVTTDYFAQDLAGNVWWVGREGVWEADVDGARAGLAMAATPRFGDGYRLALLTGVVEDRARVTSVDAEVTVPAGSFDPCVVVDTESPLVPGTVLRQTYAEGVGLVETVALDGPGLSLALLSGP